MSPRIRKQIRLRAPARRQFAAATRAFRLPRDLRRTAPVFAALGEDVRLALVYRLCTHGPLSTPQLRDGAGITRQAVSKHLEILESAGVVRSRRVGRERVWEVDPTAFQSTQEWLKALSRGWNRAVARLKAFGED
jgi:DNA-binding transcriptional ArsR family regulator